MSVQFIIDSAADYTPQEAQERNITLLPMTIIFGKEVYLDRVELTVEQFYEKLIESDRLPTTCQIPPATFSDAFAQAVAQGDTVVAVTISSKLSGTYQSAALAAQDFPGKVFVVDSLNATLGERILIEYGLRLRDQGLEAREIAQELTEKRGKIHLLALLDTLEYLKKGGRISPATALAGTLLSIKPVVTVENGEVAMAGKARGSRQGNNLLRQLIEKCGGVNFEMPYCLAYTGLSDYLLQKYIADSAELWQGRTDKLPIAAVGATVGTHVGPGAVAVAFFSV